MRRTGWLWSAMAVVLLLAGQLNTLVASQSRSCAAPALAVAAAAVLPAGAAGSQVAPADAAVAGLAAHQEHHPESPPAAAACCWVVALPAASSPGSPTDPSTVPLHGLAAGLPHQLLAVSFFRPPRLG